MLSRTFGLGEVDRQGQKRWCPSVFADSRLVRRFFLLSLTVDSSLVRERRGYLDEVIVGPSDSQQQCRFVLATVGLLGSER